MGPMAHRKQRLRTLENRIRKNLEGFVQAGTDLREIRDDELFKEGGFDKWDHYLKQRVGLEFGIEGRHAKRLIQCAEIRPKLPDLDSGTRAAPNSGWSQRAVQEFGRMVPDREDQPRKKNYAALKKSDATRVAKAAIKLAEEDAGEDGKLAVTSMHVRKAVDADLGIDRAVKAKETQQRADRKPTLAEYLHPWAGKIEGMTENLSPVSVKDWKMFADNNPELAERFAAACKQLASIAGCWQ